jgi:hypothetical protein
MVFNISRGSGRTRSRSRGRSRSRSRGRSGSRRRGRSGTHSSNSSSTRLRSRSKSRVIYKINTVDGEEVELVLDHSYNFPKINNENYRFVNKISNNYFFQRVDSAGIIDSLNFLLSDLEKQKIRVPLSGGKN